MSAINDALNNLEKKAQALQDQRPPIVSPKPPAIEPLCDHLTDQPITPTTTPDRRKYIIAGILLALIISLVLFGVWRRRAKTRHVYAKHVVSLHRTINNHPFKGLDSRRMSPGFKHALPAGSVQDHLSVAHLKKLKIFSHAWFSTLVYAHGSHDESSMALLLEPFSETGKIKDQRKKLLTHLVEQEQLQLANDVARYFIQEAPMDLSNRMNLAELFLKEGRPLDVINLLQARHPAINEFENYYGLMAYAYLKLHDYKDGLSLYRQLVSVDDEQAKWWMGMGISYHHLSQNDNALAAYRHALRLAPLHAAYHYYLVHKIENLSNQL